MPEQIKKKGVKMPLLHARTQEVMVNVVGGTKLVICVQVKMILMTGRVITIARHALILADV